MDLQSLFLYIIEFHDKRLYGVEVETFPDTAGQSYLSGTQKKKTKT
jgi:hypothetical protein